MPVVVTLVLQWDALMDIGSNTYMPLGWNVKVNGLDAIMRSHFRIATTLSWVEVERGRNVTLVMIPREQPEFAGLDVCMQDPPMDFITEYLNVLTNHDYKVVSAHPVVTNKMSATSVWTLEKSRI